MWDNGASVLHPLFREDLEEALAEWGGGYGLPEAQVNLARSLFERKTADPGAVVALSRDEVQLLRGYAGSGESFEAGRQAFAAIGVQVPAWDE